MRYPVSDHRITLAEAVGLTTNFRANQPSDMAQSEVFTKAAVDGLLATEGAAYLRIYYGMKVDGEVDAILVAADADGNDILPASGLATAATDGPPVLEDGFRCPQYCPSGSPLSGN